MTEGQKTTHVSPGFEPRPSLSVEPTPEGDEVARVSPGFEPRPSLSDANARSASA